MEPNKKIIARLSRYRDFLHKYKSYGTRRILSSDLAASLGVTADQVRKDFSICALTGKKKVGYEVDYLIEKINGILSVSHLQDAVLAGLGPLGMGLLHEGVLSNGRFRVVAAFDDREVAASIAPPPDIEVLPLDQLTGFVQHHHIQFGIVASTCVRAQHMVDLMVMAGIRGILSFSPLEVKCPRRCVVGRINIPREIESMVYFANNHSPQPRAS